VRQNAFGSAREWTDFASELIQKSAIVVDLSMDFGPKLISA
jgi:hypothetical protein